MPQSLPEDPVILLSFINTNLRDYYASLEEFCKASGADRDALERKLDLIDYHYDDTQNQFV